MLVLANSQTLINWEIVASNEFNEMILVLLLTEDFDELEKEIRELL